MGSSSLPRASDQPEPQTGDLAIDAGEIGAHGRQSEHVPLFSLIGDARMLIASLIAVPGIHTAFLVDRTLVRVDDFWWGFCNRRGHGLGSFVSEREAESAVCRACEEDARSEQWAGQFIEAVRHALSVELEHLSTKVRNFE